MRLAVLLWLCCSARYGVPVSPQSTSHSGAAQRRRVDQRTKPTIIATILLDDLGFYDTAVYNPDAAAVTPALLQLANEGIRLHRHYVYTLSLLSEKLANAGWINHFIGKGHLGYATTDHLPTARGFKTHVGYLGGMEQYNYGNSTNPSSKWNTSHGGAPPVAKDKDYCHFAKDFWHDQHPGDGIIDEVFYSTNWYTRRAVSLIERHPIQRNLWLHLPYQAVHHADSRLPDRGFTEPPSWEGMPHGQSYWNKSYGDMLAVADAGIANITSALKRRTGRGGRSMYSETLLVVSSDNGGYDTGSGPTNNFCGSPCAGDSLRGHKATPYEGGTRVMAFVSGGWLPPALRGTASDAFVHITDWYPTILSLVGIDPADDVIYRGVKAQVDGINVWPMITNQTATSPREYLREYLPITPVSILWRERYKLITDAKPTWRYTPNATHVPDDGIGCSAKLPCLFDILNYGGPPLADYQWPVCCTVVHTPEICDVILQDPGERHNLAIAQPAIVSMLTRQLSSYKPYVNCLMTKEELQQYDCSSPNGEAWGVGAGYRFQFAGPCCFKK